MLTLQALTWFRPSAAEVSSFIFQKFSHCFSLFLMSQLMYKCVCICMGVCIYIYIYIYIYNITTLRYTILYIVYNNELKYWFSWQDFLVCPGINLKSCAAHLRHSLISKFWTSGAATDQICSFNGHDETIIYTTSFVTHHIICCSLAYDIMIYLYGIFSTTRSILS